MSDNFYGWIGKTKKYVSKRGGEGTDTSKYIKYYAIENGAKIADNNDVKTKNLLQYNENYYYVLSIAKGRRTWAPYPFIDKLRDEEKKGVYFILTQDGNSDGEGILWCLQYDKSMKLVLNNRNNAGDYYSLPIKTVKEKADKEKANKEYKFSLYNEEEMNRILTEILGGKNAELDNGK